MGVKKPLRLPPSMRGDQAYFQALGRFMHEFAQVETQALGLLRRSAGLSVPIAKVLFAGMHADQSTKYVKNIMQFKSPDPHMEIELKATQLKHLNSFRNDLVHFGANIYRGGVRATTNIRNARNAEGLRNFPASPTVLRDATHDLLKIFETFSAYAQPEEAQIGLWYPWHKKLRAAAWRYKPPQGPAQ